MTKENMIKILYKKRVQDQLVGPFAATGEIYFVFVYLFVFILYLKFILYLYILFAICIVFVIRVCRSLTATELKVCLSVIK